MNHRPICLFDSGIGGATILKEVMNILPNENYIYYADNKNNPYGNKTKEELFTTVCNVVDVLKQYHPKFIICACNTATMMVLNAVRKKYKEILFVGTEPAIKVLHDKYPDKKALILTTKGTGESQRFQQLWNQYKTPHCTLMTAPLLASLIENNEDTYPYLRKILGSYKDIEVVVLGCTHFPLVKEEMQKVLGNVLFLDGSYAIARRVKKLLFEKNAFNMQKKKGTLKIISTSNDLTEKIERIIT